MKHKQCRECHESFPETADHFKKTPSGGLQDRCLNCRRLILAGKRKKHKQASMQDFEKGAVNAFIREATTGGQNIPHSSELLERIFQYLGGTSGFSALLVKQYFDAAPGSATRTKIMESLVRLVTKNTELGGSKKPLGQWTEEELQDELDNRLKAIAGQFTLRISYGTEEENNRPAAVSEGGQLVRVGPAEGVAGGAVGPPDRGAEAVLPDGDPERDPRVQGE